MRHSRLTEVDNFPILGGFLAIFGGARMAWEEDAEVEVAICFMSCRSTGSTRGLMRDGGLFGRVLRR